ncbi:MAG: metal-sensitive transcriptional regulator [Anaerolineales bacterium]
MDIAAKESTLHRLRSIAGHVRSIERMVADDEYCIDVIKQVQAVQAALAKVSTMVLDGHLNTCVTTAIRGDDVDERQRVLSEIVDVYRVSTQ